MTQTATDQLSLFQGKGEMATLINAFDWTGSPLGSELYWPKSLHFTIDLLLQAAFPMFLFWGNEHICFYNDAFRPALGKEGRHPAALGMPGRLAWAEIWDTIEPLINAVMEGQATSLYEDHFVPVYRNGKIEDAYWTFSYNPVKNDNGQVQGVLAICHETTNKVKAKKAADSLQEQLHLALAACDLGTWDLDPQTLQFKCNEKTKQIFGLAGHEYIDLKTAVHVIHPDDRQLVQEAIHKALDFHSGGRYHVEYTVIHPKTGDNRIVKAQGRVYFNSEAIPEKFTGTIQDITEEKLSFRSKEKLQQLVEHSIDYMSMATLDGQMTYMNAAGRKLVGLADEASLTDLKIQDFYTEEQFVHIKNEVIPALNSVGHWNGFVKIRHQQTGEEIPCQGNYILVKDPVNGNVISRALMLRDLRPDLQARKELEDSEKRFRNLVQEAPVATAIYIGREMKIQWANDAMIKLWGKDKNVIGKTVREALPEIEDQPFHGQLDQVYTTGEIYQATEDKGELMVDGKLQTFYFNFSYKPLRDTNGTVYGILNMAIDVTEMVNNRRKLEESEKAFRNLIMQAPVGICLLKGTDYVVDVANAQYVSLVGRTPEDLIDRPIWEALPEAKAQGFDILLDQVKKTGTPYFGNEHPVDLNRNGKSETVYVNFVYEPLFNETGEVHSILVIAIDISQQVKLRQRIEIAEERARLAVASGNLGTYEVNLRTGEVIASARFNELFDIDQEATHDTYVSKIHPGDLTTREQAHEQALTTGTLQYQCRIQRRDGSENWLEIHGQVYYDPKQAPYKIIGIVQDITEQKNIEQELEKRVLERTAELLRLNEELQQFTYISSHDLKEPLRKIQIFGSLAREQADAGNAKLLTSLDKVVHAANRMTSLLNDLIQYSTLPNKGQSIDNVDLNKVLQDIVEDSEILVREKSAIITAGSLPVVEGIRFQLARLFFNLIQNALKFSKGSTPAAITIQSSQLNHSEKEMLLLSANSTYYKIQVQDNGIGFKQEAAQKIFVVFQRLHDRETYSGNGIGLALCKKIVENHNGKIFAESEINVGSVFTVVLPERLSRS